MDGRTDGRKKSRKEGRKELRKEGRNEGFRERRRAGGRARGNRADGRQKSKKKRWQEKPGKSEQNMINYIGTHSIPIQVSAQARSVTTRARLVKDPCLSTSRSSHGHILPGVRSVTAWPPLVHCLRLSHRWLSDRGVARGARRGGANRPGSRVEGAPMKPTISTKLLFYRIILVCFKKKIISLLIDVLAPHWQKLIRSLKNTVPHLLKISQLKI